LALAVPGPATPHIDALSLHDALPISLLLLGPPGEFGGFLLNVVVSFLAMGIGTVAGLILGLGQISLYAGVRKLSWAVTQFFRNSDRKSTRLNSSHVKISYAVFCLKKK